MYKFYLTVLCLVTFFELYPSMIVPSHLVISNIIKGVQPKIKTFKMPESCISTRKMNYCFSDENYPTDIVEKLLPNFTNLTIQHDNDNSFGTFSHRDSTSCKGDQQHLIYYVVDTNDKDRVVVQLQNNFTQSYTVRTCKPNDGPTKHFSKTSIEKHNLYCTETLMEYTFLVLKYKPDYRGNYGLETISTKIPVCCTCRYDKY